VLHVTAIPQPVNNDSVMARAGAAVAACVARANPTVIGAMAARAIRADVGICATVQGETSKVKCLVRVDNAVMSWS
jgi:hypothetical protein